MRDVPPTRSVTGEFNVATAEPAMIDAAAEDKRDNRRIHRWAPVGAGLLLAFGAVAFGAWWLAIALVAASACIAAWALLA